MGFSFVLFEYLKVIKHVENVILGVRFVPNFELIFLYETKKFLVDIWQVTLEMLLKNK